MPVSCVSSFFFFLFFLSRFVFVLLRCLVICSKFEQRKKSLGGSEGFPHPQAFILLHFIQRGLSLEPQQRGDLSGMMQSSLKTCAESPVGRQNICPVSLLSRRVMLSSAPVDSKKSMRRNCMEAPSFWVCFLKINADLGKLKSYGPKALLFPEGRKHCFSIQKYAEIHRGNPRGLFLDFILLFFSKKKTIFFPLNSFCLDMYDNLHNLEQHLNWYFNSRDQTAYTNRFLAHSQVGPHHPEGQGSSKLVVTPHVYFYAKGSESRGTAANIMGWWEVGLRLWKKEPLWLLLMAGQVSEGPTFSLGGWENLKDYFREKDMKISRVSLVLLCME